MNTFPHRIVAVCLGAAALCVPPSAASADYPTRPIRVITPFPPGSATDVIARLLSEPVSRSLGQPVIVDNRPGADGAIAAAAVAHAEPDGYTLLMATSGPMAGLPAMKKNLPYNPRTDFSPVADVGRFSIFLWTSPQLPAKTVTELIAYARANPNKLNYATGNVTGIASAAQLLSLSGTQMVHVPYKGEPAAVADLVAGRVHLMFASPANAAPLAREGKLRAMAFALSRRSPAFPDVPTMAESGMPGFSLVSWTAVFAPARLPADIAARLNQAFAAAMRQPEVVEAADKQQFLLTPSTPQQLGVFLDEQIEIYGKMLREAGIQPE
ncbi:MAG TPA: tripartite tricarboxylate transporter substrate binding protein [Burkholderiaceae bacterium]|nr:tripartite tricarboxylate transporter substrate binding protein [Burkholderiaceae bacterium]